MKTNMDLKVTGNFAHGNSRKGKEAEADWKVIKKYKKPPVSNRLILKSKFLALFFTHKSAKARVGKKEMSFPMSQKRR